MEKTFTLRYRTSDDWAHEHVREFKSIKEALTRAYDLSVGDLDVEVGDISINYERIDRQGIEEELLKIEYYEEMSW